MRTAWRAEDAAPAEAGLSLIEVMIGAVVVLVFLGALLSLFAAQGDQRRTHLESALATNAVLSTLERARGLDLEQIPGLDGQDFDVLGIEGQSGGLTAVSGDPDGLPGEISVAIDQALAGEVLYRVTAKVSWEGEGRKRELSLQTLVGGRR